jgi:hypothetical protein
MDLIPIMQNQECTNCHQHTMETSVLNRTSGRTRFIVDACIECGFIHNYTIKIPRPRWHRTALVFTALAAAGVIVFWACQGVM